MQNQGRMDIYYAMEAYDCGSSSTCVVVVSGVGHMWSPLLPNSFLSDPGLSMTPSGMAIFCAVSREAFPKAQVPELLDVETTWTRCDLGWG